MEKKNLFVLLYCCNVFFWGEGLSSEGIIHGALICVKGWPLSRVGDYSGGNCPGGGGRGFRGAIVLGGNCPRGESSGGGGHPGGGAIVRGYGYHTQSRWIIL